MRGDRIKLWFDAEADFLEVRFSEAAGIKSTVTEDGDTILKTVRNALAHGNVVYLNKRGHETPGDRLQYLAFLSKGKKEKLSKGKNEKSYRVAIFSEESFLTFVKLWITWLQTFTLERELVFADEA